MKTIMDLGLKTGIPGNIIDEKTVPVWLKKSGTDRKTIQLAGLGDVGRNAAMGLALLGEDEIESIGLYDLNEAQCKRMETELSQIAAPPGGRRIPAVSAISWDEIFC